MLHIDSIYKSFGNTPVLRGVSCRIQNHSCIGIVGPSGAGKSVLLKVLAGILSPDAGSLRYEAGEQKPKRVGFLFQEGALFDSMTVLENVAFPLLEGFPQYHATQAPRTDYDEAIARSYEMLTAVGLGAAYEKMPGQLSGGMRRRLALARALVHQPELVLLDDPTAGLDPVAANVIMDLIQSLYQRYKPTLILVSHDLRRLLPNVERVLALFDGVVVGDYPTEELAVQCTAEVRSFIETRFDFGSLHETER